MELELEWEGTYKFNEETPKDREGLDGLFAILYDSKIIYIGKSSGEKHHLFQESNFRYKPLKRALIKLKKYPPPLNPVTLEDRDKLDKIAEEHCKKYVGILRDESKLAYLDSAEKLLIFIKKPEGNDKGKKKYRGVKPLKLINKGKASVLEALELENYYVDTKGCIHSRSYVGFPS